MSPDYNAKGYHYPVVVNPDDCVECDLCEVLCPDFAIFCLPAADADGVEQDKEASDAVS